MPNSSYQDPLASCIPHLAGVMSSEHFGTGDLAALRRGRSHPGFVKVYYQLLFKHLPNELQGARYEPIWEQIFQHMAIMAPTIHSPTRNIGRVLRDLGADAMEHRFLAFLRAPEERRYDYLRQIVRLLKNKGLAVDWISLSRFLLTRNDATREKLARSFARAFYHVPTEPDSDTTTTEQPAA